LAVSRGLPTMRHLSAETMTQVMLAMGVLMALVIVGVLIVQRFRGGMTQRGFTAGELMANFQEMRGRGDISDADYRKIKSVLGDKLQSELNDGKDKG
jgi:uncharacterized membrane protein